MRRAQALRCEISRNARAGRRMHMTSLPPFERVIQVHGPALLRFCAAQVGPDRAEDCLPGDDARGPARLREGARRRPAARLAVRDRGAQGDRPASRAGAGSRAGRRARAASPAAERRAGDDALWQQVRALPAKQRQAVTLRYVGDLSLPRDRRRDGDLASAAARRNVFEGLKRLRQRTTMQPHGGRTRMTTATPAGSRERVDALDWTSCAPQLDDQGLRDHRCRCWSGAECEALVATCFDGGRFRSTIDMARYRFGDGPLPLLRPSAARGDRRAARRRSTATSRRSPTTGRSCCGGDARRFPLEHEQLLERCRAGRASSARRR